MMAEKQIDIIIITETWLTSSLACKIKLSKAQSLYSQNQGVTVLCESKVVEIQAINLSLWTPNNISVKLRIKILNTPLYVLAHSTQPGSKLKPLKI